MKIKLTIAVVRDIHHKQKSKILTTRINDWDTKREIERDSVPNEDRLSHQLQFSLSEMNAAELKELWSLLQKVDAPQLTIDAVLSWYETMQNANNAKVNGIEHLNAMLKQVMKDIPSKWLFKKSTDGHLMPILVTSHSYHPPSRHNNAYTQISYCYGKYYDASSDSDEQSEKSRSGEIKTSSVSFSSYNIWGKEAEEGEKYNEGDDELTVEKINEHRGDDDDDNDNDDDDFDSTIKKKGKTRKKVVIKKRASRTVAEVLETQDIFFPTTAMLEQYIAHTKEYYRVSKLIGHVFTVKGLGYYNVETGGNYRYSSERLSNFVYDEIVSKLVVDTNGAPSDIVITQSTTYGEKIIPYHPYLKLYDISKHRAARVHIASLKEYDFNINLGKEIALKEDEKHLLDSMINGEIVFTDIISGKSGGIIVLASGIAGSGKTLTAEVYSEVAKKPLYQIQSSQLGLSIEDIESNLDKILKRADKWKAVLLIDECDTYVNERGEDMLQNCIVGTFLRLLEYYNGILFLTTNRHDIIDSAIISRLTAHIKYGVPPLDLQIKIFGIIAAKYGITIEAADLKKILATPEYKDMVGRDIRNLLKLVKKVYHKEGKKLILKPDMLKRLTPFIPFINKKLK